MRGEERDGGSVRLDKMIFPCFLYSRSRNHHPDPTAQDILDLVENNTIPKSVGQGSSRLDRLSLCL